MSAAPHLALRARRWISLYMLRLAYAEATQQALQAAQNIEQDTEILHAENLRRQHLAAKLRAAGQHASSAPIVPHLPMAATPGCTAAAEAPPCA